MATAPLCMVYPMNKQTLFLLAVVMTAVSGCQSNKVWVKDGATQTDFEQDKAQCVYESTAATQSPDYGYNTVVVQALDQSMRRDNLAILCMQARGWSLMSQEEYGADNYQPPPPVKTTKTPYGECTSDPKWFGIAQEKGGAESLRLRELECSPLLDQ